MARILWTPNDAKDDELRIGVREHVSPAAMRLMMTQGNLCLGFIPIRKGWGVWGVVHSPVVTGPRPADVVLA